MTFDEYEEFKELSKHNLTTLSKADFDRWVELNSKLQSDRYEDNKAKGYSNE